MKRGLDLLFVVLVAPIAFVIGVAVALTIGITLGRPIFFVQTRIGLKGKPFQLYKFRTMSESRGVDGTLLADNLRLTATGAFLRRWSLDELPQLVNVLKGDISVVGPRPLLPEYLPLYSREQARRHDVRPGLTGWAQVNGRNDLTWEEKFALDVWYVDNQSVLLDVRIILLTVAMVVRGRGIAQKGHVSMERFTGRSASPEEMRGEGN